MPKGYYLFQPQITPPLDADFRPAVLVNHAFQKQMKGIGTPLVIGIERDAGKLSRFETLVFPEDHPLSDSNLPYVERLVKFLLWQRGGYRLFIGGPSSIGKHIKETYSENGARRFDSHFMGDLVYEHPFSVEICMPHEVPLTRGR